MSRVIRIAAAVSICVGALFELTPADAQIKSVNARTAQPPSDVALGKATRKAELTKRAATGPIARGPGNVTLTSGQTAVRYPSSGDGVAKNASRRPGDVTDAMRGASKNAAEFAPAPAIQRAIMPPAIGEEALRAMKTRTFPANLNQGTTTATFTVSPKPTAGEGKSATTKSPQVQAMRVGGDVNPLGPASIAELARSLRYHPDLIYQFVRNNIEFHPTWAVQKGAFGTILDNQGNVFDQASLMVQLLRASGFEANFVRGVIRLSAQDVKDWYGIETSDACAVANVLAQGQIPVYALNATSAGPCPGTGPRALTDVATEHIWVKTKFNGTWYYFDPSFKPHTFKQPIDFTGAMQYNPASYLSSMQSHIQYGPDAVTFGPGSVYVRSAIGNYAYALWLWLLANKPAATLDDVLGGKEIVKFYGALRDTAPPKQDTGWGTEEWTEIPNAYRPTLRIQYEGIDQTYTSDAIYGKLLTITYNGSNQPVLKLDGVAVGSPGNATTPGNNTFVTMTVKHNGYSAANGDHTFTQRLVAGGTYVIGNGWGPTGRGLVQYFADKLEGLRSSGASETSDQVVGSSLSVLGAQWLAQFEQSNYVAGRLSDTSFLSHHQVGIVGLNTGAYVDLGGVMVSNASALANVDNERTAFLNGIMHSSILESTAVHQTTGVEAVSTVKLLDVISPATPFYNVTSANYAAVKPNLINSCGAHLANIEAYLAAGMRVIIPQNCEIRKGNWKGAGYFTLKDTVPMSMGAVISGGLSGGNPIFGITPPSLNAFAQFFGQLSPKAQTQVTVTNFGQSMHFGDPVDMVKGGFLYDHDDMAVGVGDFPSSLTFKRLYSSGARNRSGSIGKGWTHNLAASLSVSSDGLQAMGEDSALDAVSMLAEYKVATDLLKDASVPLDKLMIATLGQAWFGEQLINNTAVVNQGLNGEVFVKVFDGKYNPPPGKSAKLTKNADGTYKYETVNRAALNFNAAGKAESYVDPSGLQVKYTYSGNELSQVQNSLGRSLWFVYASGRISKVGDGVREVNYGYDGNGNLTSFKDATGQTTTYAYGAPGQMTQLFYPSFPTISAATNTYDSLGRVRTQTNARGKTYEYFFAGSRSEEIGPGGVARTSYIDGAGNVLQQSTPMGNWTVNTYDGQQRIIRTQLPQGNGVEYTYDDASCATSDRRCTHNVKTVSKVGPAGSGLTPLVQSFTYESAFNKVATATDARGKVTSYTYTAQGLPLTVTSPVDAAGVAPQTSHTYASYTPSGWPTFFLPATSTVKTTATNSVVTTTTYNTANKYVPQATTVDSGTGKLNLTTSFTYDAIGNLTLVDGPRTDVTDTVAMVYDNERRVTQVTDAAGKQTRTVYDADGRPARTAVQFGTQWMVSCAHHTETGKVWRNLGPALTSAATTCPTEAAPVPFTDTAYDDLDRPFRVTQYVAAADGGNRVTETVYNNDDTVKIVKKAVGTAIAQNYVEYVYTPNGNVDSSKDAKGNLTVYSYDGFDRLTRTYYPLPDSPGWANAGDYEENTYDANGNVTTLRKRSGQNITQTWDNLNRLTARTYPTTADNVQFGYDLRGLRTSAQYAGGGHAITYIWDNAGRLTSTTAGGKTLAHQYDAAGNRTRTTWPDAFYTTTTYDALNRPGVIKENGSVNLASYAYDDLSRRTTVTLGNGTSIQRTYDNQGALATLKNFLASTAQEVQYTYVRNQIRELKSVTWSNNIYQWTGAAPGTKNYTANGLNRYTVAAGATMGYDGNGNLTGDGTWTYGYDLDNRLKTASKTGLSATLAYDAEGRLRQSAIGASTINLLYDGQRLVAEYDAAGTAVLRKYVHGPGSDEPIVWYEGTGTTAKNWLYTDHLGSVVATANATGASTATYTYGPFGEPNVSTGLRFRYTGQQLISELGLYYYKARFYSPTLGRFLQTDPIGYKDDQNLYAYARNNPANRLDPSGLASLGAWAYSNTNSFAPGPADSVVGAATNPNVINVSGTIPFPGVANPWAFMSPLGFGLGTMLSIPGDSNSNREPPERMYGPYYRSEQTAYEAQAIISSGVLYGGIPMGGSTPAAMAYTRPFLNSSGNPASHSIEFMTPVRPTTESRVGATWYLGTPGVMEFPGDRAAIPVFARPYP